MLRFRVPDRTMATLDTFHQGGGAQGAAPPLPRQEEIRSAVRDAFLALDAISVAPTESTAASSPTQGVALPSVATPPPGATPASPTGPAGARLEDIFTIIHAQRAAWTHVPLWSSISPSASPLGRSPDSDRGLPTAAPHVPPPFEFEVSESTFASMLDVTVGSHSSTVQHIQNVLNMPSVLRIRADGGTV
jgi:hypothetical protein